MYAQSPAQRLQCRGTYDNLPSTSSFALQRATGGTVCGARASLCVFHSLRVRGCRNRANQRSSREQTAFCRSCRAPGSAGRGSPWGSAATAASEVRVADSAIFIEVSWAGPISEKPAINVFKCSWWLQLFITTDCRCSYNSSTTERFMAGLI